MWKHAKNTDIVNEPNSEYIPKHAKKASEDQSICEKKRMPELGNLLFGCSFGKYPVNRDVCQLPFSLFLEENGFDHYGNYDKSSIPVYENDVFRIQSYYWGDDEDIMMQPNFVYKPTGFTMSWYKYPMRDAYVSDDISLVEFQKILNHCAQSMKE